MSRAFLGLGGLVAGAFIAANVTSNAQQEVPVQSTQQKTPVQSPDKVDPGMVMFLTCAKECSDCARSCELASNHCAQLMVDGEKKYLDTLRASQDCAAICTAASRIMAKDGPFSDLICASCIEACKRCAALCEKSSDPIVSKCA